jgi:hypothetical protein
VHQAVILRNGLGVGQQRGEMLLDGLANVPLGLFASSIVLPLLKQPGTFGV